MKNDIPSQARADILHILQKWSQKAAREGSAEDLFQVAQLRRAIEHLLTTEKREPKHKQGDTIVRYAVEAAADGFVLSEYRSGSLQPFRVPRDVFDETVRVLSVSPKIGAYFEQILEAVRKVRGQRQPDYQPRTVIRFLLRTDPKLLVRDHGLYRPIKQEGFVDAAYREWAKLQRASN
jgi:hypothetical protein